ncbi:Ohr subfamily peroxiredoxin [Silvimonas terrae]|uniref:Ohr subfamily peroxiredoxin n=1 Tax=Silvimonas terrae TaxID=300266 RepID=A0A840RH13_9NEIS|nr:Ohr family peroxiredoxin [Silvimonas terrae]MBB5191720.1 Ohr subfamily peroxiredoxin [Silvimonas terrae]
MEQHKMIYTAKVQTIGGRDGTARSVDGRFQVLLAPPGAEEPDTSPEQLFAAGWSACFEGAMQLAARKMKVSLPPAFAINTEIDLQDAADGYFMGARLKVSLPELEYKVAQAIIDAAHQTCLYSKATPANIHVALSLA